MPPRSVALSKKAARGRPRSLDAKRAVLAAARELVEKGGYPAATIDAVAARSGVAKTTIYRWWPNRAALLVELLMQLSEEVAPPPAGPDPVKAIRTELMLVAEAAAALPGRLLASLLGEGANDPEVHAVLMRGVFTPRRKATARVIERAQAAGAIRSDIPPGVITDLFFGPVFARKYIRQEPVTRAFVTQVFEVVLAGLKPRAAGPK